MLDNMNPALNERQLTAQQVEDEQPRSLETHDIKHEHLASIIQHDWYVRCEQVDAGFVTRNDVIYLEHATYRVICLEQGQTDEISFTNLNDLMAWAGY